MFLIHQFYQPTQWKYQERLWKFNVFFDEFYNCWIHSDEEDCYLEMDLIELKLNLTQLIPILNFTNETLINKVTPLISIVMTNRIVCFTLWLKDFTHISYHHATLSDQRLHLKVGQEITQPLSNLGSFKSVTQLFSHLAWIANQLWVLCKKSKANVDR